MNLDSVPTVDDPSDLGSGWVYLVRVGGAGRPVKIGWTASNPAKRVASLQTANSGKVRLIALRRGGIQIEKDLHFVFGSFRIRGEWFVPANAIFRTFGLGWRDPDAEPEAG
jgi:hypothetical protein